MGNIKKVLGDNIRNLRNSRGLTQIYLADCLEITSSFLAMVESGQRGISLELIEKIAEYFEITPASLFIERSNTSEKSNNFIRNAELNSLKTQLQSQINLLIENSIESLKR